MALSGVEFSPPVATETISVTTGATCYEVARALRQIANRIERDQLVLIGLWSTGFGDADEAVLQVVTERSESTHPAKGQVEP